MGKKVNPKILRMGITKTWPSLWFERGDKYITNVKQDVSVRKYMIREFREAGIDAVDIVRTIGKMEINVTTAKPGLIIGRGGNGAEDLKKKLHDKFLKNLRPNEISLNIKEVGRPNLSSQILVQGMILDLEKRQPFRKIMKQGLAKVERAGALGAKVVIAGRLNGAEIARSEKLVWGKLPLQTLRADIDYARGVARTTYGAIGIKVWIYKGEIFKKEPTVTGEVIAR
ncbi:30S ribosomal protein S3 [Candidatus Falkowbacteria bacterium]|uniref:Small ribosomal subunit protein uS3 n=1 Tax=Candidatus Falkowbacteria bacterium CG10_big_fil_rev_8_21_14_0_10_37_18 TaxID=1974562 RepID=A0A2H0V8U9_9BACT|nr:30S ribosomal protein S3 [Candidatus Falkowbacteria bacterium]NCQ12540.1 30S ribosomal protein S3 [Candidatus Falkowbacteria bacterium]OIO06004.1 MAG: 30S ribosomal protein S3 [Candidatus Falkowbacteria bacterium CG1_02_37_21]PIR95526.1 MAG: 30S ribosomal protein S3 [Candidatus Falkowbacteria bacterium CG10_big_fil_rev_8_21_14_0_10_37_18]